MQIFDIQILFCRIGTYLPEYFSFEARNINQVEPLIIGIIFLCVFLCEIEHLLRNKYIRYILPLHHELALQLKKYKHT